MDLISQINNIQLTSCISEKLENKSKYTLQQAAPVEVAWIRLHFGVGWSDFFPDYIGTVFSQVMYSGQ